MSVSHKGLLSLLTMLVFVCCVSAVLGEEVTRGDKGEDDTLTNQRDLREYIPETWHAVQNIKEGASGWIPREPLDSQSGVVTTKRRRLRKRKRRPPVVVSFIDDSVEEILQPTKKFVEEEMENAEQDTVVPSNHQITLINDRFSDGDEEFIPPKRRKRPNVRAPWEDMQEESVRPYVRRKVTPAYQNSEDTSIITSSGANSSPQDNSKNNPDQNRETGKPKKTNKKEQHIVENKEISDIVSPSTTTRRSPNLKAILKQNGGLSLSEILQQKNITLAELLMGNQEAIKALTGPSEATTTASTPSLHNNLISSSTRRSSNVAENVETLKYKRLPPSIALKKENINRKYEQYEETHETLTDKELFEAQRKRLALLKGHDYKNVHNDKFADVTRYDVIAEPTTEKRIFVPSHPNLYTSVDYKPEVSELAQSHTEPYISKLGTSTTRKPTTETTQSTTPSIQTTDSTTKYTESTKATTSTKSKHGLPITSAKLHKMTSKRLFPTQANVIVEEENYPATTPVPFSPIKINVDDILAFLKPENQPEEEVLDAPLRMSIDLDTIPDKSTEPSIRNIPIISTTSTTTTTSTITQDIPKLKPFSAKDEILEILKDPQGRARLAKILESRNMTVQELIDQRERGSSQLHLADIFHNKTKEPEPLEEAFEGRISSEVFTSFPVFLRQPKTLFDEEKSTQKPEEATSQRNKVEITAFPSFKIEVAKDLPNDFDKSNQPFPWKQLYPDLFNVQDKNKEEKPLIPSEVREVANNELEPVQTKVVPVDVLTREDIQRYEDLDQRLFSSVSSELLNIVDEDTHKVLKIPSGVQSAIVASLVIVGLSLLVFVTILVVFKWTQKQKTQLKYHDSLKPPLFDVKSKNIRTFVAQTLGKSKFHYYKNNLQSTTDNGWERESDRKASF